MNTQLSLTLVQTRQKLAPFIDDGVVMKDRKPVTKKKEESNDPKIKNQEIEEKISNFQARINDCIANKEFADLENVLNDLVATNDDSPDNLKVYHALRLKIIQGQICLAQYFKWMSQMRES